MRVTFNRRRLFIALIYFLLCAVGLYIFSELMVKYQGPSWYYHPIDDSKKVKGAVGRGSLFTYFTYVSLLIFCMWGVLYFFAVLSDNKKFISALTNGYLLTFVTANEILTMVSYTSSQFFSAVPFGFVNFSSDNLPNFLAGLYMHYVLPISALVFFFKFGNTKRTNFKKSLFLLAFPAVYAIIVKLVGMFAFKVEWYPYAVFSTKAIWLAVFKSLENFNFALAVLMMVFSAAFVGVVYTLVLWLLHLWTKRSKVR